MTPCPLCRTDIDDTQSRCPSCGTRVRRDTAAVPPPAWSRPDPAPAAPSAAPTAPDAPAALAPAYFGTAARPQSSGTALLTQAYPIASPPPPVWAPPSVPKTRRVRRALAIGAGVVGGLVAVLFVIGLVAGLLDNTRASDTIDAYTDGRRSEPFTSSAGGFHAEFPTRPVPVDQTMQTPDGHQFVFHDFVSRPGRQFVFEVGYFDLGVGVTLPDERAALAGMVDAMAGQLGGRVASSAPSSLQGANAEDFTVEYRDHGQEATAIGRVALRDNRVYFVAVSARGRQGDAFDRLVTSFRFTAPGTVG